MHFAFPPYGFYGFLYFLILTRKFSDFSREDYSQFKLHLQRFPRYQSSYIIRHTTQSFFLVSISSDRKSFCVVSKPPCAGWRIYLQSILLILKNLSTARPRAITISGLMTHTCFSAQMPVPRPAAAFLSQSSISIGVARYILGNSYIEVSLNCTRQKTVFLPCFPAIYQQRRDSLLFLCKIASVPICHPGFL